jgi:PAS domain S-box-containing protein
MTMMKGRKDIATAWSSADVGLTAVLVALSVVCSAVAVLAVVEGNRIAQVELAAFGALLAATVFAARRAVQTERRALQQIAAREREAVILDAALRTVPIAVAIIDRDLRYIRVNAATATMTGIAIDAHPGRTLRDLNPRLAPELEAAMRTVIATGEPRLNFRLTRPTPHVAAGALEIVLHITPFRDQTGAIAGIVSAAADITEWKSLQDQFYQAQKLEAVGKLAASIAHDFNNLLTVVSSCADLMLMQMEETSPYRAEAEEIRNASGRATALARRMLGMSRASVLVSQPLDLAAVVTEARDILKRAAGSQMHFELHCDSDTGLVLADPSRIEQIVLNLVLNAVDATPHGGTVSVVTRAVELAQPLVMRSGQIAAGAYCELLVTDSGTGMPETTLAHIFEPFFTTKPPGKGTGLGLATVFSIVRDLGGGVDVHSTVGRGSTFRILLPRLRAEGSNTPPRFAAIQWASLPGGTETILLVEDEDTLRASVARVFTRKGYQVVEARHGGEALRLLNGSPNIALVVSDLHMAGMDGHELVRRMQALGRRPPVLFMSGSTDDHGNAPALPSAAQWHDRFIAKPIETVQLLATVRSMLDGRSLSD